MVQGYRSWWKWQALNEYLTNPVNFVNFAPFFVFMLPIIHFLANVASVRFGAGKLLILLGILLDRIGQVLLGSCFEG
jgi:hypothetical protein